MSGGVIVVIGCILFTGGFCGWWLKAWNDRIKARKAKATS
jgi:hypothetical protein